ncbi:hypothetical protein LCGC14_2328850, partial [marine sediment metagenome]
MERFGMLLTLCPHGKLVCECMKERTMMSHYVGDDCQPPHPEIRAEDSRGGDMPQPSLAALKATEQPAWTPALNAKLYEALTGRAVTLGGKGRWLYEHRPTQWTFAPDLSRLVHFHGIVRAGMRQRGWRYHMNEGLETCWPAWSHVRRYTGTPPDPVEEAGVPFDAETT